MKITTQWQDLGMFTEGHAIKIVTMIYSTNEDEIEELKQSLGATYTIVNTESDDEG